MAVQTITEEDLISSAIGYVKGIPGTCDVFCDMRHLTITFRTDSIKRLAEMNGSENLLIWKIELGHRYSHIKVPCITLYYTPNCWTDMRMHLRERFLAYNIRSRTKNIDSPIAYVYSRYLSDTNLFDDDIAKGIFDRIKEEMDMAILIDGYLGEIIDHMDMSGIMNKSIEFDTSLSFADATPGYWDCYDRKLKDNSVKWVDVEEKCDLLKKYQYELYNKRTYIGKDGKEHLFILDRELNGDNGIRYASDSITVSYRFYSDCRDLVAKAKADINGYESWIREFIRDTYTIGGEMIFPKHNNSINQARGRNHKTRDRFDLTLLLIKKSMEGKLVKGEPLYEVFNQNEDKRFFEMFRDFNEFCRFFFLDDMLKDGEVKLFCPFDGKHPFPNNVEEYLELIENQRIFVEKRNERIREYMSGKN